VTAPAEDIAVSGARRQSLFREVNERIDSLRDAPWRDHPEEIDYICECADEDCAESIQLTAAQYRRLREQPRCFIVAPDGKHVRPEIERVVAESPRYWVVEKTDRAGTVAESLDPRATSRRP
jgi:hypothetical protein